MTALAQRKCPLGLDEVDLETWRLLGKNEGGPVNRTLTVTLTLKYH